MSELDLRKIEIVYGPECRKRDRQEKIELCQNYPGVARRKREVPTVNKSLRVNPNITPPPEVLNLGKYEILNVTSKELGIEEDMRRVVDNIYKMTKSVLQNVKYRFCNDTFLLTRRAVTTDVLNADPEMADVIEAVSIYVKKKVDKAIANLTELCEEVVRNGNETKGVGLNRRKRHTESETDEESDEEEEVTKRPTRMATRMEPMSELEDTVPDGFISRSDHQR